MKIRHIIFKTILLSSVAFFIIACGKERERKKEIVKNNENGLPIMHPLEESFPKLTAGYVNEKKHKIEQFFNKIWNQNDNVSFLVAQNGQVIYENYLGFANRAKGIDITAKTPLHIASVSKVLTATAVLLLIDAGKIRLEQKVTEFLPDFPYPDVTVLTLLNHRSGMKNYAYFTYKTGVWDIKKELTNEDIVSVMKNYSIPLESKIDSRFGYCNTNYAILALLIEKVTHLKYPEAMQEMIFKPLGMTHTFVYETAKHLGKVSLSYRGNMDLAVEYLDGVYGDKNIYSTPRDLLKFDMARYSQTFLTPELLKQVYKGYSYEKKGERNYGLGIRMLEFDQGTPFYYHNGWWHGNTSCFINMRKERVTMFVISNKFTRKTYQTKKLAPLFGDYPFKTIDEGEE
ncbi:serine hydrolase domain-containing protein [Flavobacterium aciduliphilum]|uniref:CubicO group peptidase (Beta-lactamase class C family) n=1 Tax=Flavobacterium aciduliphilum TaxID=1101402 RepID=A0A328YAR6_9FLAO|nr:serine hydrolase domain-containing protein [Flavobacterium aciduliphilum]RAR70690.1 CubicO group peptidase (beta-lactamase class C family) [Flavobacterium aciduliphilum]